MPLGTGSWGSGRPPALGAGPCRFDSYRSDHGATASPVTNAEARQQRNVAQRGRALASGARGSRVQIAPFRPSGPKRNRNPDHGDPICTIARVAEGGSLQSCLSPRVRIPDRARGRPNVIASPQRDAARAPPWPISAPGTISCRHGYAPVAHRLEHRASNAGKPDRHWPGARIEATSCSEPYHFSPRALPLWG